jgi:hypothetical protein
MKTNRLFKTQLAAALLLAAINSQLSTAHAQIPLSSSGGQIIRQAGSYYLTGNLSVRSGNGIIIATNGVTLDLRGFTISTAPATPGPYPTPASAAGTAILLNSGLSDITIVNGHIRSGVTNNGGVYSGSGFNYGIYYSGNAPMNVMISKVSVGGVLDDGINLGKNNPAVVVETCTVTTAGGHGIVASIVKDSVAADCGNTAILGTQVLNCMGSSVGGDGIEADGTAQNCYGETSSTDATPIGLMTGAAINCCGTSFHGTGLQAMEAQNCEGISWISGTGLFAYNSVQNCYGQSQTSMGLNVGGSAQNCYGNSVSGTGLNAGYTAQNCYGESTQGTGLNATLANSCYGWTSSGTGLTATYASFCFGTSVNVTGQKYNMP